MFPQFDGQPPTILIRTVDEAVARAGSSLGTTAWFIVSQEVVDAFGQATGDVQWIHTDPVRAATGPFGACVAHGLLTLSLAGGKFFHELVQTTAQSGVNYGCDRVRYPTPVRVGTRIRAEAQVVEATKLEPTVVQMKVRITVEVEKESRPACVADFIVRYLF